MSKVVNFSFVCFFLLIWLQCLAKSLKFIPKCLQNALKTHIQEPIKQKILGGCPPRNFVL